MGHDKEADVHQLQEAKPCRFELTDDDIIIRYEIIGFTVLNASRRRREYGHGVNIAYLASVLHAFAKIHLRGTSDTLRTLSEIP